tara:strand:- start:77 stop:544 length:468 start_codon:yes stop_codon:yes gene_type:complete
MSKWVLPTKYYVSFPCGIYNPDIVRHHRRSIRGNQSFYLSYNDKTVRDGIFLGFTFFPEDWPKFKWNIKNQCTGGDKNLPLDKRWSSQHFTLDKIFNLDTILVDQKIEVKEYYDMSSWANLQKFYSSDLKIPRPTKQFMKPYIFRKENGNDRKAY